MNTVWQRWLLLPHALSNACLAPFVWMREFRWEADRLDMILGTAGFLALAAALLAGLVAAVLVIRAGIRREWPWLLVHLGGLAGSLTLANYWLAHHIA